MARFHLPDRRSLLLAGAAFAALPSAATLAQGSHEPGARQFIETLGQYTLAILHQAGLSVPQREAQLRELLRQGFDLAFIGRFVLGRAYNGLSPEQAADYHQAFSEFVLRTYARRLAGFQMQGFAITGSRVAGETDTVIVTRIDSANGQPIMCDWRVRTGAGRHAIIDVTVSGVSMAVTQRDEFAAAVNTKGVGGLVTMLRARTEREGVSASR